MKCYFLVGASLFICACKNHSDCPAIRLDKSLLDSAINHSDTSYSKKYRNQDFVMAEYYINRLDTSVCQVMKDSTGQVRQVILANKKFRFYVAEFYSNGQLMARLPFNNSGKMDGEGTFYFETGCVKSRGLYRQGLYSGEWINYNQKGKIISKDEYDSTGQLTKSVPEK